MKKTKIAALFLLLASFSVASASVAAASNASAEECRGLGFTGLALCSDCDRLEAVVHDAEIVGDCRRCCTAETAESNVLYDRVILEVCPWHLQGLPAVQEFIDKHAEGFGERVTVKRIPGRSATLKFRNKEGGEREDVRVDAWKTEHLLQFLEKKLKAVKAAAAAGATASKKKQ